MSNITTLAFENTTFEIVDQNGQPWLRATDVANALGYSRSDKVGRLYSRNADEFTPAMTAIIEAPTSGLSGNLVTETRIFSLRGAHLLAMFARTEKAKAFRVWLLDLIEAQARNMSQTAPAIGCDYITTAQKQDLKELVNAIVATGKQTYGETWARLQSKFRVNKYEFLPASKFDEARDYLLGKLPNDAAPIDPTNAPAMVAAHRVAIDYMNNFRASVREGKPSPSMGEIPTAVLQGILSEAIMRQRMLVSFNPDTGRIGCTVLGGNEFISDWPRLVKDVATGECMCTSAELLDMAAACMQRLQQRGGPARLAA